MDENQENFRTLGKSANLADKSGNNGKKIMQFEQLVPLASQLYIDAFDDWISRENFLQMVLFVAIRVRLF